MQSACRPAGPRWLMPWRICSLPRAAATRESPLAEPVGELFALVAGFEAVQAEGLGQLFADFDAAEAVAFGIQRRREDADAGHAGDHGHDAAADAALGRQ